MNTAQSVSPLPGYITLKLVDPETKTSSGLELPDTSQEKPQMGKVLAIGKLPLEELIKANTDTSLESVKLLRLQKSINEGDTVIFKKYTGNPVKVNGEEIQLVEFLMIPD